MNEAEEQAYIQGQHSVWLRLLDRAIRELGYPAADTLLGNQFVARYISEREKALAVLRDLCAGFGDTNWDSELALADIIDKHLGKHLWNRKFAQGGE